MKVFITRELSDSSVLKTALEKAGHEVLGFSLVEIKPIPIDDYFLTAQTDWLFFYSKNGAEIFLNPYLKKNEKLPKVGAIGKGTAAYIEERFGIVSDFVGNGTPEEIAAAFERICADGEKILFPRAERSEQSIQKAITKSLVLSDVVVYSNEGIDDFKISDVDVLVFTSPLNAEVFFKNKTLKNEIIFSIGATTAKALEKLTSNTIHTSPAPDEFSLGEYLTHFLSVEK